MQIYRMIAVVGLASCLFLGCDETKPRQMSVLGPDGTVRLNSDSSDAVLLGNTPQSRSKEYTVKGRIPTARETYGQPVTAFRINEGDGAVFVYGVQNGARRGMYVRPNNNVILSETISAETASGQDESRLRHAAKRAKQRIENTDLSGMNKRTLESIGKDALNDAGIPVFESKTR